MSTEQDDLPKILARALVRAWNLHEASGPSKLSVDVARPLLARHLVTLAKEGMTKEGPLVAAGLQHLISLASTPPSNEAVPPKDDAVAVGWSQRQPPSFHIEHARAKFLLQWRIPWQS